MQIDDYAQRLQTKIKPFYSLVLRIYFAVFTLNILPFWENIITLTKVIGIFVVIVLITLEEEKLTRSSKLDMPQS